VGLFLDFGIIKLQVFSVQQTAILSKTGPSYFSVNLLNPKQLQVFPRAPYVTNFRRYLSKDHFARVGPSTTQPLSACDGHALF
jgi:hypothetical protein